MRFIFIFFLMSITIYSKQGFARALKITVNPEKPVINEPYTITFTINTSSDDEPIVDFKPLAMEILSKEDMGKETYFNYINGKSSSGTIYKISYQAISQRQGAAFIRNIKVKVGDQILKHDTMRISILKEALKAKNIYVKAVLDKDSAYVGESILIRYYIYYKRNIRLRNAEIRRFPKLDKFLKRFYQEPITTQSISVDGLPYSRRLMYTAQVFADKSGEYKIDSISLKLYYSSNRNTFNSFGLNFNMARPRSINSSSKSVRIEIKDLPIKGLEDHFTGLVGQHSFKLKINKEKFIANEPIEMSLTVVGKGALELFEAPVLISDPTIEEFEKNSDFKTLRNFSAEKIINYTYLGRENISLSAKKIPLSYFDPEKKQYIVKYLNVVPLTVAGANNSGRPDVIPRPELKKEAGAIKLIPESAKFDFQPIYKIGNTFIYYISEIFYFLLIVLCTVLILLLLKYKKTFKPRKLSDYEHIKENGISYVLMHKLLKGADDRKSMFDSINDLDLSQDASKYFKNVVAELNDSYDRESVNDSILINKKHFKELEKATSLNEN